MGSSNSHDAKVYDFSTFTKVHPEEVLPPIRVYVDPTTKIKAIYYSATGEHMIFMKDRLVSTKPFTFKLDFIREFGYRFDTTTSKTIGELNRSITISPNIANMYVQCYFTVKDTSQIQYSIQFINYDDKIWIQLIQYDKHMNKSKSIAKFNLQNYVTHDLIFINATKYKYHPIEHINNNSDRMMPWWLTYDVESDRFRVITNQSVMTDQSGRYPMFFNINSTIDTSRLSADIIGQMPDDWFNVTEKKLDPPLIYPVPSAPTIVHTDTYQQYADQYMYPQITSAPTYAQSLSEPPIYHTNDDPVSTTDTMVYVPLPQEEPSMELDPMWSSIPVVQAVPVVETVPVPIPKSKPRSIEKKKVVVFS